MKIYIAAAALLALGATAAQAQPATSSYPSYKENFSLTLLGGWSGYPSLAIGGGTAHSNVDDGFNAGGRLEYGLKDMFGMNGFSIAADGLYNQANYGGTFTGTKLNSSSAMFDILYHIPTDSPLRFYGGAGVGGVHDNLDGPALHGSSTVFGWQVLGGAEYALSASASILAEYRYQNAHDANIAAVGPVGNTSNNVSVGVKFSL